jgi:hypothetical protein
MQEITAVCKTTEYNKWGRTDDPKDLTVGAKYAVDYVVIHGSYTQTILVGDPERAYNSCNFDFFDKDGKEIDIVDYFHHQLGTHEC